VFSRYRLPPGAELYVYGDARAEVRGAYTELENRLDGQFSIRPLRGEALTLEYYEPASASGQGELTLSHVAHDYRGVYSLLAPADRAGGGTAGQCELDTACPLGAPFPDQIKATVHIESLIAGLMCSGVLLNNTSGDGSLLVLAAEHCGGLSTAIFTFNFERPGCRDGVAPCTNTVAGALQLVRDPDLDVQLLRINGAQGALPYPAYLLGWDRTDTVPAQTTLFHHPAGGPKKISQDFQAPVFSNNFWRIRDWDRGATEGGSSGGPMIDTNGRCIGILDSGSSTCNVPTNDDFATRFSVAWPLLEPYLDPLGTGQTSLDGLDYAGVTQQPYAVSGIFPPEVEPLTPTTSRVLRVLGSGLKDSAEVFVDGIALDRSYFLNGGHSFLNIDLPPIPVGSYMLSVLQDGVPHSLPLTVVPASVPRMQTGRGFKGESVFSPIGVDTFHSDVPGHLHYCYWSLSNAPSFHPYLSLAIGNGFTDLRGCKINPIPASGFLKVHHPIPLGLLPLDTTVFNQTACVSHGLPLATSNTQETVLRF
jgi:hypothetical protein